MWGGGWIWGTRSDHVDQPRNLYTYFISSASVGRRAAVATVGLLVEPALDSTRLTKFDRTGPTGPTDSFDPTPFGPALICRSTKMPLLDKLSFERKTTERTTGTLSRNSTGAR